MRVLGGLGHIQLDSAVYPSHIAKDMQRHYRAASAEELANENWVFESLKWISLPGIIQLTLTLTSLSCLTHYEIGQSNNKRKMTPSVLKLTPQGWTFVEKLRFDLQPVVLQHLKLLPAVLSQIVPSGVRGDLNKKYKRLRINGRIHLVSKTWLQINASVALWRPVSCSRWPQLAKIKANAALNV